MPILTDDERLGTLLAGKYRVRAVLARGGMGVLFEGEHTWTGRSVAIKLLQPTGTADPVTAQRFLREGRAATALRHPHVVDVLDMGQAEDGALFMVLELLRGADLGAVRQARGPQDAKDAIELVSPVIDALALAHESGIVHRDIKPSNVFLARQADGSVLPKLLDFGIAKALGEGDAAATKSGVIVGTPHYMSPEQAEGLVEVGPASDTWSLGVVLYELVSGSLPYDGGSPTAILMTILQRPHVPLIDVSPSTDPAIASAIERALARDPAERPSDLRAWAAELRAAAGLAPIAMPIVSAVTLPSEVAWRALRQDNLPTDPPPAPRALPLPRSAAKRGPAWLALGAALVLFATLVVGIAVAWRVREPDAIVRAVPMDVPAPTAPAAVVSPPASEIAPPTTPAETATATATESEPSAPSATHAPRPTRPARVPSGSATHGRRPVTTITTTW